MKEAGIMAKIREAHSVAMKRTASKLRPEVLQKQVRPIRGKVGDVDPAELAARAVAQVVEKSEEAFGQVCQRMSVNSKLVSLEKAWEQHLEWEQQQQQKQREAEQLKQDQDSASISDLIGQPSPLPGGRKPAELVRETTMKLKLAERARLLELAEEAERRADAEAEKTAKVEAAVAEQLTILAGTQQGMAEAASFLR
ncbi:unnamed protein product [Scytosiphon promiscuus]